MLSILRQRIIKHLLLNSVRAKNFLSLSAKNELYFAYGANLSLERFTSMKMNVEEVGNACLFDYEICFTLANEYKHKGYAGVRPKQGKVVWGVLYRMDKLSLALLDTLEWAYFGAYERKKVKVSFGDNTKRSCWSYIVKNPKEGLYPSKTYISNMIKASKERRFPRDYIQSLEKQEYRENFELDHGFSLLFYGKRRLFENELKLVYRLHDKVREKLCDFL